MSQIIPIYIPTFISDAAFSPARVLPHIYFYNGLIDCEQYWIESGSTAFGGVTYAQTQFPYFDNYSAPLEWYNTFSGSTFPDSSSLSLLFNNEAASYGEVPTGSLYTDYWQKYVSLLYNPKTRLLNCSAIIPLKDYFTMELNDIVNFRGNYYHLRAINDYSLKDGSCTLQLLGPIIADTFADAIAVTPTTTTTTTTSTTTTTTTTTSTTTTTTTTTLAPDCSTYQITNTNSSTGYWSATGCGGSGVGGTVDGNSTVFTGCIITGTIGGSPNLVFSVNAIC